jgi:lysozyme
VDRERLTEQLIRDEGLRLKPYKDTAGKLTIGVGRNLTDRGVTQTEAIYLLNNDMDVADLDCRALLPWWDTIDPVRQGVLVNMCFNLGADRFKKFVNTLALVQAHDYERASIQMLQSLWAEQVGDRALRLADQMRSGQWR